MALGRLSYRLGDGSRWAQFDAYAKQIYSVGSQHFKRVQCQGAAKKYIFVMPDSNLDEAISSIVSSFYGCAGQRCLAGSQLVGVGDI